MATATKKKRPVLSPKQREAKREAAQQRASELHETLTSQVAALASSEEWTRYLKTMTSFHKYSFNNTILILSQRPDATHVAGYRQWEALGRQVLKGETSIKIYGYSTRKFTEKDGQGNDVEKRVPYFPVVSVFDISQTEGDPLPEISSELDGSDDDGIYARTEAWLTSEGWTVERGDTGAARGYTDPLTRVVRVSDTLSDAGAAKTILHEAAHVVLHADLEPGEYQGHRGTFEVEAESVAYVVAGILGMDTSSLSVGYVTGWAMGDEKLLQTTAENVHRAVRTLVDALLLDDAEVAA